MEQLRVENFLVIKKAELNVSKICVIIGPQASGKSVLAKLLHLFREFFDESTPRVIQDSEGEPIADLEETVCDIFVESFSKFFPGVPRDDHAFQIEYKSAKFSVLLQRDIESGKPNVLFSEAYLDFLKKTNLEFSDSKQILPKLKSDPHQDLYDPLVDFLRVSPIASPFREARKPSLFIPASRAYFASVQKHIFSLLRARIPLDHLIVEFGFKYEVSRENYKSNFMGNQEKVEPLIQSILAGQYLFSKGEDWILSTNGRVKLQHASSGQQEALPLLAVLSAWGLIMPENSSFIIEEPEAHLYPKAQNDIVSLFGLISNQRQLDFFITTHSPYILAALNNLILADEVKEAVGPEVLAAVIDPDYTLKYADVSAYTLRDGVLYSILDEEEQLIGVNAIDGVSDEFGREFEALLELRETGEKGAYSG